MNISIGQAYRAYQKNIDKKLETFYGPINDKPIFGINEETWKRYINTRYDRQFTATDSVDKDNSRVIAYTSVSIDIPNAIAHMGVVSIDNSYKGNKIEQNLIEEAEGYIRSLHIGKVRVSMLYDDIVSRNIYENIGYRIL